MNKFNLEFTLNTANVTEELIRNSLIEFGENLIIAEVEDSGNKAGIFKICMQTEDPTIVFDACSQLGRLSFVKVEEKKL